MLKFLLFMFVFTSLNFSFAEAKIKRHKKSKKPKNLQSKVYTDTATVKMSGIEKKAKKKHHKTKGPPTFHEVNEGTYGPATTP